MTVATEPAPRLVGWRALVNAVIALIGAAFIGWGLFVVGTGAATCRGVEMKPGDVCTKGTFTDANSDETQSYEQRLASAKASRPTVIGLGVALVAFAVVVHVTDRRRRD